MVDSTIKKYYDKREPRGVKEMNEYRVSLEAARVNAGLTQDEAAKKIGVSKKTIVNYEKGYSVPNWNIVMKMAEVYSVPIGFLKLN